MRSRAVGIDKRQKGFVNLSYSFRFVVEHFESVYRLRPAPSKLGAASEPQCLGPPCAACGPSRAGPTQLTLLLLYWKMAQTLGVYANMLQVCNRFRARSTNVSI